MTSWARPLCNNKGRQAKTPTGLIFQHSILLQNFLLSTSLLSIILPKNLRVCKPTFYTGALASGAPWVSKSTHPRKFDNHVTVHLPPADRLSAPQAYQCKITQSTSVATQIQREVILARNRIATRVTT